MITILTLQAREAIAVFPTGHILDFTAEAVTETNYEKRIKLTALPLSDSGRDLCIMYGDIVSLTDKWKILESFKTFEYNLPHLYADKYEKAKPLIKC
jgi:hypothetical protein